MDETVQVPVGSATVGAELRLPAAARGVVVFAHGSGSSRHSPRNRAVAQHLDERGLATLLMDLLTREEEQIDVRTGELRFDVGLLADRLDAAAAWMATRDELRHLAVGYFGASTGAAAALVAAARRPTVRAVVSRGGRPDLAAEHLPLVTAPTLLIVGGLDTVVLELNREAADRMRTERRLAVIPGATHLFEEADALERVSTLAAEWFVTHLDGGRRD